MEQIRQLTEHEMPLSRELIHFAFKYEGDQPLVVCRAEDTWGFFIDGELASNIVILPLETFIQGETHKVGVVAGVASWPEYRKSGTIRKLMIHGLGVMRDNGQTVSYLGPFSYPFYRRFGYEMMYAYKSYTVKAACVPDWRGNGKVRRVGPDIPLLNGIYERYAVRYNGMMKRSEERWNTSIFRRRPGQIAVYFNGNDEPTGYMIYQYAGTTLKVHEMVFLDRDARCGLWEFIRKQDSMYENVMFTAPADDPFTFLIDNPKGVETKLVTHLMARIVDVRGYLEKYRFEPAAAGERFVLHVSDEHAPWNEGSFELRIGENGIPEVRQLQAAERDIAGELACDIKTLSTMMMGYQTPTFLYELGRLAGDGEDARRLEAAIPKRTPYYIDFAA